jgi:hypothetical protein
MSERSSESHAEWVNEELRDYEGFPAILSLLQRAAGDFGDQPTPGQLSIDRVRAAMKRTLDEERAAQEAALNALIARPEIADLVQRIQEFDEERRSRALSLLFASSGTENSPEE